MSELKSIKTDQAIKKLAEKSSLKRVIESQEDVLESP